MSSLITELGYVGFEVSDLAAWETFAEQGLGMRVCPTPTPQTLRLRTDRMNHRFLLVEGDADDFAFAGWRVRNQAALDLFAAGLEQSRVAFEWASDADLELRAVDRMLHFRDPIGARQEVFCGPLVAADRFISPHIASGFVTGDGGAGHIVFEVGMNNDIAPFMATVMGFGLTDHIRLEVAPGMTLEASFLHLNRRHHSLAYAKVPPRAKSLHHASIEVGAFEDVGRTRDRCLDLGFDMAMDIGQHPNDQMFSFYTATPSGFFFEVGCGGALIDPATQKDEHYDRISSWGHRPLAAPEK